MSKRILASLGLAISAIAVLYAASGTPNTLRVNVDSTGALVVASGGAQTPPITSTVFSNARLSTDANGNLLVAGTGTGGATLGTNTFTGIQTISIPNLTATPPIAPTTGATGLTLVNPTSAVTTDQNSPALAFCSNASGTTQPTCFQFTNTQGQLLLQKFTNGVDTPHHEVAAFGPGEGLHSATVSATNFLVNFLSYANNVETDTDATNAIITYGTGSNFGVQSLYDTADTLKIRAKNRTDAAKLDVKTYSSGGTVGVSCAAGTVSVTTMVVTNGIVTHC